MRQEHCEEPVSEVSDVQDHYCLCLTSLTISQLQRIFVQDLYLKDIYRKLWMIVSDSYEVLGKTFVSELV